MKVLMISNDKRIYDTGSGPAKRMLMIGNLTDGLEILILGLGGKAVRLSPKVEVIPTGHSKLFSIFRALNIIRKLDNKNSPVADVISAQDPFLAGLTGLLIKKFLKLKLQIQLHTDIMNPCFREESFLNQLRYWMALFLIPRADCVRVVSQRIRNSLKPKFPGLKISVLPIFVDVEKITMAVPGFNLHEKYPRYNFIILMASRFAKEKNIDLALSVMAEIVKKYPQAGLIIVGRGPLEDDYKLRIKNLGLDKNVKIEPWTEDVVSYYKTADLFLLTSNYEGYGLSLVEAVISGCPAISTDVGVVSEVIKERENGFIVPVGDKTSLVNAISKLIKERELLKKFKQFNLDITAIPHFPGSYFENYIKSLNPCLENKIDIC